MFACNAERFVMQKQQQVFYKKGVLKNLAKFTGKYLYQSPFFNKEDPRHLKVKE